MAQVQIHNDVHSYSENCADDGAARPVESAAEHGVRRTRRELRSLRSDHVLDHRALSGSYNNLAFDKAAENAGLFSCTIDGDAFSDEIKNQVRGASTCS